MTRVLQALMLALLLGFGAGPAMAGIELDQDTTIIDEFDAAPDDFAGAVPEPAALIAMGVGLATVAFVVHRRSRR